MTSEPPLPVEHLLAETNWVTKLARALVRDPVTADDVAQATWVDILRSPPRQSVRLREWLAAIVRRKVQRLARTDTRRRHREQVAAVARSLDAAPSAAELAARVTTHRELVDAVLALDEPYRETVVLRFFENLDLEAIGARTQSKHNTVRSRLQRGLQLLRDRLDRMGGGRERWQPALLVLSQRRLATEPALGATGMVAGIALAITMKKILLAAAVFTAGVLISWPWLRPEPTTAVANGPPAAPSAAATATAGDPERLGAAPPEAAPARFPAASATPRAVAPRRLVDRDGQPLAKVLVRAESPFTVRWQGGDRGWISGPERSLRILPADEERLRMDPAFAQQFFAEFTHPDEWRATVLGTPLPAREVRSEPDGAFHFPAELEVADRNIAIGDPDYVLITAGATGERPWLAGPTARVTGVVRNPEGRPLADTFVMPMCPLTEGAVELANQLEVRTDDDGTFLVRKAAANGLLRVAHEGYETAFAPVGAAATQVLDIVLRRREASAAATLHGLVVDGSGNPIADAFVWFGRQSSNTGADGRFVLPADGPQPQYALTIVARGYALLQQDDFGTALAGAKASTQDLLFVLTKKPLTARGLVLGSDGAPLASALVGLLDPTLLDLSFEGVEARVGGWSGGVATGPDGTFALAGLGDRAYRFRAIDPTTGASATSEPLRADAGDIVLRLPSDLRRWVRGVVQADGNPPADTTVEIGYCTHITKGGGTQFDSPPAIPCDKEGRFSLPVLPRRGAWLCVRVGGSLRHAVPVEALPETGEVTIELNGRRWLQLVGSASPAARAIHFELASGQVVATGMTMAKNGDAPVVPIPADAVAVVLDHGRPGSRRLVLTDDRAVLLRVR